MKKDDMNLWECTELYGKAIENMVAENSRAFDCASIIRCIKTHRDDIMEDTLYELSERVLDVACRVDDGRFTFLDMADAVGTYPVDVDALLRLDDDEFDMVLLCMSQRKRDTYSTDPIEITSDTEKLLDSITTKLN